MTTSSWAGRRLPAALPRATFHGTRSAVRVLPGALRDLRRALPIALRPVRLADVPADWERQAYDAAAVDDDALTWLGFEAGPHAEPLLPWPQPARWPVPRRTGRHRVAGRMRTA